MTRVYVTLDPEYIPWEHAEDTVRLRKTRTLGQKVLVWAMPGLLSVLAFVGIWLYANRATVFPQSPEVVAGDVHATDVVEVLPVQLTPETAPAGQLCVVQGTREQCVPCAGRYMVMCGYQTVATGDDGDGIRVEVPVCPVSVRCDGKVSTF